MLKLSWRSWSSASREAAACVGAGLRDLHSNGLWWRSALWCMTATFLWIWLYVRFAEFFLKLSGNVTLIAFVGILSHFGTQFVSGGGIGNSLSGLASLGRSLLSAVHLGLIALAIGAFFYILLFVSATLTTIRLPLRWVLLASAKAAVAARYPAWQPAALAALPPLTAWDHTRKGLKILLALCIPVWAAFLIVRVLLECNVLLMYRHAAEHVLDEPQRRALAGRQRPVVLVLGLILCLLMLIPAVNLLVPALLCSSVCHLQRRGWVCEARPTMPIAPSS